MDINLVLPARWRALRRRLSKVKQRACFPRLAIQGQPVYATQVHLDRVLIGQQCGRPLEKWLEMTGEWSRASCLLQASPYVRFLQAVSAQEDLIRDDEFLQAQPYFRMAETAIAATGSYFAAKTHTGIKQQMRSFYETYASIRDGSCKAPCCEDFRHSAPGEPVLMSKVAASSCYELMDGHHRAAIDLTLGRPCTRALIVGEKATYLQTLLNPSHLDVRELLQPIDKPEVSAWTVRRQCPDRLKLVLEMFRRQGKGNPIRSVLDAACCYGWFVHELRQRALHCVGVTPSAEHVKVGRIAYGLADGMIRQDDLGSVLRNSAEYQYDAVLFLDGMSQSTVGRRREDECEMLRLLDRVTGRILILDSERLQGASVRGSLSEEQVLSRLRANTSFQQVIALGKDHNDLGTLEGKNGRTLFACIRQHPPN